MDWIGFLVGFATATLLGIVAVALIARGWPRD